MNKTAVSPVQQDDWVLCHYFNSSNYLQIARIENRTGWRFERVVFPKQRLLFNAPVEAELEVQTSASTPTSERIPCSDLACTEGLA